LAPKRSFLQKRPEVLLLFLIGVTPLLWLTPGYIIAKGDEFPSWLNPHKTLDADVYLWDVHNMGNANTMGSFMLYGLPWLFLIYFGLSTGLIQILIQIFFFMGGGFAMYYLSKTIYSKLKLSPLISSIFYMFNFFVLQSRLNIGMAWAYTFLPLLMALLIKIVEATLQQHNKTANKNIIYFAITSTIALSFASINPANVIITLLVLAITLLYYIITQRNHIRRLLLNITKLTIFSILLNLWWMIPILNNYLWSPSALNPEVSVTVWSWTHARASFLNLFWLNGQWSWRPEYVSYYYSYSNPILLVLTFIPFLLATSALLFKTNRSQFNTYLMLAILIFLFLAKGLHEPLSQLNLLLYTYIPSMTMLREPVSKFTMALMPFLALLIGYAVHNIANVKIGKHKPTKLTKILIVAFFTLAFVMATHPLVTNPIETKTTEIPFSSYVKIPDYWYEATEWLDSQPGDSRVLITPPDDFYMVPYTWGYYGTDGFMTRFIQKPILSYYFGYRMNPNITTVLQYLYSTIECNKTAEFKALLDLLNIKYILQRNDIQHNLTGRNIIPPDKMQTFLTQQPFIRLAQKFGQLDIYEYTDPKPYIYILSPATLQQTTIKIENIVTEHGYTSILNTTGLYLIFQNKTQTQPATIINYIKVNPTKMKVTINATKPFILAISEALDQLWTAHTSGKQYKLTSLYLGLKGFHINETGQLEITIEYEPQKWFYYSSIISVTTFLACLTYLTYNWTKNKTIWKRTKIIITRIRLILHHNQQKKNIQHKEV